MIIVFHLEPLWLCLAGGGAAFLYLLANLKVRREYMNALAEELRSGRLDLAEIGDEIGNWEATRLARLWDALLDEDAELASPAELGLPLLLAKRGIIQPLLRGASHHDFRVRRACIEALASAPDGRSVRTIAAGLRDAHPSVRMAALGGLAPRDRPSDAASAAVIHSCLEDRDPGVRAEAAMRLGAEGVAVLEVMAGASDPAVAVAALQRLSPQSLEVALERARDRDPGIRAEALECAARLAHPVPLSHEHLASELSHEDVRVRLAALRALAVVDDGEVSHTLARGLGDASREVRSLACELLGERGHGGVTAASAYLEATPLATVSAALGAIAAAETSGARQVLAEQLRHRVHDLWRQLLILHAIHGEEDERLHLLELAYRNATMLSLRVVFLVLELSEDSHLVRTLTKVLRIWHVVY